MGAYTRKSHDGKRVNARTKAMLVEAEKRLGYELSITQGSYNAGGVAQSAGTHDGGGAVDLRAYDWQNKVRVLREVGFAAWYRPTIPGHWNEHVHAIAIGDKEMSAGAARQVQAYYAGRDGLAGNRVDTTWRPNPIPVFSYWKTFKVDQSNVRHEFMTDKPRKRLGVKRIQRALNSRLGLNLTADGLAGTKTRNAWLLWETKLKYKEPNSIPNAHSLKALGVGRWSVIK